MAHVALNLSRFPPALTLAKIGSLTNQQHLPVEARPA
jgi:hypothetical protein